MSWAIILCAHGETAKAMIHSVEMIAGKQENIGYLNFLPGEGTEDLQIKLENTLKNLDCSTGVLILVDLFGGSPFNVVAPQVVNRANMDLITGVNMPMLLDIVLTRDGRAFNKAAVQAIAAGKDGVDLFNKYITKQDGEGDDL